MITNWNPQKFNQDFDNYIKELEEKNKKAENEYIKELNAQHKDKQLMDLTITEFIEEWKFNNLMFIKNLINGNFTDIIQEYTLFYLALTMLIVVIVFIIIKYFDLTSNNINSKPGSNTIFLKMIDDK